VSGKNNPLIFELSKQGRRGYRLPDLDVPHRELTSLVKSHLLREQEPRLPEVSEVEVIRHYTSLSRRNYGVDLGFYPLGSCTMKYNPKINEQVAAFESFVRLHPLQPEESAQGILTLMHELLALLCEVTGMSWGTQRSKQGVGSGFGPRHKPGLRPPGGFRGGGDPLRQQGPDLPGQREGSSR
jgi:glycine cleavage system protein P-like pyridoxal-binding family